MPESKAVIGLTWEFKLPALPFQSKTPSKSQNEPQSTAIWKPNQQLIDGLFLLPNDPSKLNKLLRKQVKDTAGTAWYLQPFFSSVFPFLFLFHPYLSSFSLVPHAYILFFLLQQV